MPAEWEPHRATWISWPHHEPDWPGKLGAIPWVYAEIARALAGHELVEVLCHSDQVLEDATKVLDAHAVPREGVRLHVVPTDRGWLRDSAPTGVIAGENGVVLLSWAFNGWAKYDNWRHDARVGSRIAALTGLTIEEPRRDDTVFGIVLFWV
jgi:agmatine deiminase